MRSLVILALAAGCSHKSAPTDQWCHAYIADLRDWAARDIKDLGQESAAVRQRALEELRGLFSDRPANSLAMKVCSDPDGDTPADAEARSVRFNDVSHKMSNDLTLHIDDGKAFDAAQAKALQQELDQLADNYTATHPAPP